MALEALSSYDESRGMLKMPVEQTFKSFIQQTGAAVFIAIPFDPDQVWGQKPRQQITGVVNGVKIRGPLKAVEGGYVALLGPAWLRDSQLKPGDAVTVTLAPEGPQLNSLDPDIVQALEAEPAARLFFESLSTYYRTAYLKWVGVRSPQTRAARIAELVALLKAGVKQRK